MLQYINGYEGGLPGFVARARELAERYGERFAPPALLVEKAEKGEALHATRAEPAVPVPAGGRSGLGARLRRATPAAPPSASAGRP